VSIDLSQVLTRLDDPATSKDAAASIDGFGAAQKVFWEILQSGKDGANCAEITAKLLERYNMPSQSISSRCSRLRDDGSIIDSGMRRPGDYGKDQIVWVASDYWDILNA
jgi:hypothetical protein